MLELWWPFLLLIVVFIAGGWIMMRAIGTGSDGSYLGLMKRQAEAMEAQVVLQSQLLDEMRRHNELVAQAQSEDPKGTRE